VQQDTSESTYHLCGSSAVVCNWLALNYTAVAPPNCKQCKLPVVGNLGLHESRVEWRDSQRHRDNLQTSTAMGQPTILKDTHCTLLHGLGYEECGLQFFILLQVIHHTLYPNVAKESASKSAGQSWISTGLPIQIFMNNSQIILSQIGAWI
jgi:hypothetical protein